MGAGMWSLIGMLISFASRQRNAKAIGAIGAGLAVADVVNLDMLRAESLRVAGNSDPQALEEAARTAARLLGLDGSQVLWPIDRRTNQPILPIYFHVNLQNGKAWFTDTYASGSYVRKLKRGRFGGFRRYGSWRRGAPTNITKVG